MVLRSEDAKDKSVSCVVYIIIHDFMNFTFINTLGYYGQERSKGVL